MQMPVTSLRRMIPEKNVPLPARGFGVWQSFFTGPKNTSLLLSAKEEHTCRSMASKYGYKISRRQQIREGKNGEKEIMFRVWFLGKM